MATTRKRITEQEFETILVDHMFGKSNINLAKEHKCDGDTIDRIITSYNIVKESPFTCKCYLDVFGGCKRNENTIVVPFFIY